ncbi:Rrf2 family transcriptional regulator [Algoriphagus resistens]|uniref:Rrf2 family transcriptional regulator n=1 Tax=Algoriphagus resistens TaxID=1750590 RepID=UPI0012F83706|nr:Rrf2 family transcriptional regulator [Algoriphagus resistens]
MKDAHLPEPHFKTEDMFTVVLKCPVKSSLETWHTLKEQILLESTTKIGKSALMISEMVYRYQYGTIPEMAKKLAITERGVEKNIQKLKAQNLLERKEGVRSGYWELIITNP